MTPEAWTVIGVGVGLVTLGWLAFVRIEDRIRNIDDHTRDVEIKYSERLVRLETIVEDLRRDYPGTIETSKAVQTKERQ